MGFIFGEASRCSIGEQYVIRSGLDLLLLLTSSNFTQILPKLRPLVRREDRVYGENIGGRHVFLGAWPHLRVCTWANENPSRCGRENPKHFFLTETLKPWKFSSSRNCGPTKIRVASEGAGRVLTSSKNSLGNLYQDHSRYGVRAPSCRDVYFLCPGRLRSGSRGLTKYTNLIMTRDRKSTSKSVLRRRIADADK